MIKTRKLVILSLFLASSVILGYVESILPSFLIPGVKLGLANIVVLLCILNYKWYEALFVSLSRILIVSFILGTFLNVTFFMSLCGGILSFISMYLLSRIKKLSPVFISISGAISHAIGQIGVAVIVMGTSLVLYYLPFILLLSIPTGILVGVVCDTINKTNLINGKEIKDE